MAALVDIEGIGEQFADKLAQAGIGTTQTLLKQGSTRDGRRVIAKASGVNSRRILQWVNHADLFRVKGVGQEYAELLEASGVDTVPELAQRNADHLHKQLKQTNDRRTLVRRIPAVKQVKRWISHAKRLRRVIEY